jgi:hypothetical protein
MGVEQRFAVRQNDYPEPLAIFPDFRRESPVAQATVAGVNVVMIMCSHYLLTDLRCDALLSGASILRQKYG